MFLLWVPLGANTGDSVFSCAGVGVGVSGGVMLWVPLGVDAGVIVIVGAVGGRCRCVYLLLTY